MKLHEVDLLPSAALPAPQIVVLAALAPSWSGHVWRVSGTPHHELGVLLDDPFPRLGLDSPCPGCGTIQRWVVKHQDDAIRGSVDVYSLISQTHGQLAFH